MTEKNTFGLDPLIPVFDRYARSWPKHADGEPAYYGPFSDACAQAFGWDAHFAAYSAPAVERRLGEDGAFAAEPAMVLFVVDVDGPEHVRTPEWWALEEPKVRAARKALGWCYCYTTKGGYRLVWALADPFVLRSTADKIRWRVSYASWLDVLEKEHGIIGDRGCADWTRCYRLPRVKRDGVDVVPEHEIGAPDQIHAWPLPLVPADDPRLARPEVDAVPVEAAAPVDPERLAEAATALAAVWPKRGRHFASLALCGALAKSGWTDDAIADFVAAVSGLAANDDGDHAKRLGQARSSNDKVSRGEEVSGWSTLADLLGGDAASALRSARGALGQWDAADLFAAAAPPPRDVRAEIGAAITKAGLEDGEEGSELFTLCEEAAELLLPVLRVAADGAKTARKPERMGLSARRLKARNAPPPRYLVEHLLVVGGVSILSGEPKSGKSWDACHVAVAVAAGKPVYKKFAVQAPAGVYYHFAEDPEASVKTRLAAVAAGLDLPADGDWLDRLYVQPRGRQIDVTDAFDVCVLVASVWLAERESGVPVALVILDPLSDIHSGEEDSRDSMAPIMNRFRGVASAMSRRARREVGFLLVHHAGKASADGKARKRGGQKMRGSSAIHGAVDNGLYLDSLRGDGKNEFVCLMESEVKSARGAGLFDRVLRIEDGTGENTGHAIKATFEATEPQGIVEAPDLSDQRIGNIVCALFDHGAPLTHRALRDKVGGKSDIVLAAINAAIAEGYVAQRMNGKQCMGYEITEAGRELVRGGRAPSGEGESNDGGDGGTIVGSPIGGLLASILPAEQN